MFLCIFMPRGEGGAPVSMRTTAMTVLPGATVRGGRRRLHSRVLRAVLKSRSSKAGCRRGTRAERKYSAPAWEDTVCIAGDSLTSLIAKVEAAGPPTFLTDLALLENRFQFRRYIQS